MFAARLLVLVALALNACSKAPDPATMSVMVFQIIENSKGEIKHSPRDDIAFLHHYSRVIGKYNTINSPQLNELKGTLFMRDAVWQLKAMCDSTLATDIDGTPQEVALAISRAKEANIPLAHIILIGGFDPAELIPVMEAAAKKYHLINFVGLGDDLNAKRLYADIDLLKELAAAWATASGHINTSDTTRTKSRGSWRPQDLVQ